MGFGPRATAVSRPEGSPRTVVALPWRSGAVDAGHLQSSGWRSSCASWEPALRHAMQASQELAAVGDPGPRADATDVEPDAQPARRDHRRVRRQVDILGDCRPREPVHAAAASRQTARWAPAFAQRRSRPRLRPPRGPFARPVALDCGKPVWSRRRGTRGGGRRVCHGAPATSAPVDHARPAPARGRTARLPWHGGHGRRPCGGAEPVPREGNLERAARAGARAGCASTGILPSTTPNPDRTAATERSLNTRKADEVWPNRSGAAR